MSSVRLDAREPGLDAEHFALLFERRYVELLRYAVRRVGFAEGEDVLNAALLDAYRQAASIRSR